MSPNDIVIAGFSRRLCAWLIDHLIVAPVVAVITVAYFKIFVIVPQPGDEIKFGMALFLSLDILYCTISTWLFSASVGKEILGLKAVRSDGTRIGLGKAIMREAIGKLLCQATLLVGYAVIVRDEQGRGLHDRIADTRVIYDPR